MKNLSSRQTFLTKYFVTAMWVISPIALAITVYIKFDDPQGFYMAPIFFLPAIISYLPMKVAFDETKIVVSDWMNVYEYKFVDLTSVEYTRKSLFSFHPYHELVLTTKRGEVKKIKYMPTMADSFNSIFSRSPIGRIMELLDFWKKATSTRT